MSDESKLHSAQVASPPRPSVVRLAIDNGDRLTNGEYQTALALIEDMRTFLDRLQHIVMASRISSDDDHGPR